MRQLGCLELKNAKIRGRVKTDKKDRPPCKITYANEPNMELMAKAFTQLYFEALNKGKLNDKPRFDEEPKCKKAKEYTSAQVRGNNVERKASDINIIYNKFPVYTKQPPVIYDWWFSSLININIS